VRRFLLLWAAGLALLGAGCDVEASADPGLTSQWPAGAAGVLCQLLEYDDVEAKLGVRFDAAGGAKQDDTLTCALTKQAGPVPYLTLALTPSAIDPVVFTASAIPSGATTVPDLGKAGYRIGVPASGDAGPGIQLVWLSSAGRMLVLRYVFPAAATAEETEALVPRLVGLAQAVDKALPA
jgi:hypothetical protein